MATDFRDIMRVGVEQFAYLKCPSKVRAALINAGGPRLSVDAVARRLSTLPTRDVTDVGEPTDSDAIEFRVTGLVKPERRKPTTLSDADRKRIADLAHGIGDKAPPEREKVFRFRKPPPVYESTAYADQLIEDVAQALGITRTELLSASRFKFLVAARSLVVKLLRDRNPEVYSYPRIASIMKRLDHSTMIYAHQQFGHYCKLYPVVADLYAEMREGGE